MLWLLVKRTAQEYGDDNCSHMAAAISYYFLFSIIPLTIFTVSIFGLIVRDDDLQQDLAEEIVDFMSVEEGVPLLTPDEEAIAQAYGQPAVEEVQLAIDGLSDVEFEEFAAELDAGRTITLAGRALGPDELSVRADNLVTETLDGVADVSGALAIVSLAGMAWAAAAMFGAVRKSLNIAWDIEVHRPVVQQKLVDLSLVMGLGVLLGASVAGTAALRTLQALSDDALGPLSGSGGLFWAVLPLFLPAIFTFVVFVLISRHLARRGAGDRAVRAAEEPLRALRRQLQQLRGRLRSARYPAALPALDLSHVQHPASRRGAGRRVSARHARRLRRSRERSFAPANGDRPHRRPQPLLESFR